MKKKTNTIVTPIKRNAEQIIRWINNDWVDLSDKSVIETLSELNEVLTSKIQ